ncbi:hypothetical protein [Pseudanabaena sp. BC1403]|nr:hypothetical protein [Pseudanabaena sp. BC1403]
MDELCTGFGEEKSMNLQPLTSKEAIAPEIDYPDSQIALPNVYEL